MFRRHGTVPFPRNNSHFEQRGEANAPGWYIVPPSKSWLPPVRQLQQLGVRPRRSRHAAVPHGKETSDSRDFISTIARKVPHRRVSSGLGERDQFFGVLALDRFDERVIPLGLLARSHDEFVWVPGTDAPTRLQRTGEQRPFA